MVRICSMHGWLELYNTLFAYRIFSFDIWRKTWETRRETVGGYAHECLNNVKLNCVLIGQSEEIFGTSFRLLGRRTMCVIPALLGGIARHIFMSQNFYVCLPHEMVCVVFFFFSFSGWGETESTWYVGHCWHIVPAPDDRWWLWSS
jgi:hypothetical protein